MGKLNIREAQKIVMEIEYKYQSNLKVKWNDIYKSEVELLVDLKNIIIPQNTNDIYNLYRGYIYIHNFAKQIQQGKELTKAQITQCKRLAIEIKKSASIVKCYQ